MSIENVPLPILVLQLQECPVDNIEHHYSPQGKTVCLVKSILLINRPQTLQMRKLTYILCIYHTRDWKMKYWTFYQHANHNRAPIWHLLQSRRTESLKFHLKWIPFWHWLMGHPIKLHYGRGLQLKCAQREMRESALYWLVWMLVSPQVGMRSWWRCGGTVRERWPTWAWGTAATSPAWGSAPRAATSSPPAQTELSSGGDTLTPPETVQRVRRAPTSTVGFSHKPAWVTRPLSTGTHSSPVLQMLALLFFTRS